MKFENDYGFVEYRLPNVPEAIQLMGKIGVKEPGVEAEDIDEDFQTKEYIYTGRMILEMGFLVSKVSMKIDEKEITSYKELINHFEMMGILSKIAGEIFSAFSLASKKKN